MLLGRPRQLFKLARHWLPDLLVWWLADRAWPERAFLYDRDVRQVLDPSTRDGRHVGMLRDSYDFVRNEVAKLVRLSLATDGPIVSSSDLPKWQDVVVELERLVTGGSTENVAVAQLDMSRLTIDELDVLKRLLAKAGGG